MTSDDDHPDLLSDITDLDLIRHLLADLHDDLSGKLGRFRQFVELSGALGSEGTMLSGGETAWNAWQEAQWSFIHGHFIATVMLCQGLVEHLLASYLRLGLEGEELPRRITFAETLERCRRREVISTGDESNLRRLMELRNPLSHFRDIDDPSSLSRRAISTFTRAEEHLRRDATFAMGTAIRILSLPAFRLGPSRTSLGDTDDP